MNHRAALNFAFELGQLRRVKHEGWRSVGVDYPESVAEHSCRAAQLAFVLAHMEGHEDPNEVVTMTLFHDIAEARTGDFHRIAKRYVSVNERKAVEQQCALLGALGEEILRLWLEVENRSTKAGKIAKDADELEQAIAAKEFIELGHPDAVSWIDNVEAVLETDSARKLLAELRTLSSREWWKQLEHAE